MKVKGAAMAMQNTITSNIPSLRNGFWASFAPSTSAITPFSRDDQLAADGPADLMEDVDEEQTGRVFGRREKPVASDRRKITQAKTPSHSSVSNVRVQAAAASKFDQNLVSLFETSSGPVMMPNRPLRRAEAVQKENTSSADVSTTAASAPEMSNIRAASNAEESVRKYDSAKQELVGFIQSHKNGEIDYDDDNSLLMTSRMFLHRFEDRLVRAEKAWALKGSR
jgi:deferrochelatase/peroxidase EfeB